MVIATPLLRFVEGIKEEIIARQVVEQALGRLRCGAVVEGNEGITERRAKTVE